MLKTIIILFIFYIMGTFLFTYKLTDVPPGINGDEAAIGYLAVSISKTGYDNNGKFLPLFTTVSWPDWKQPVTVYSTVAAFKLFGISFFNLRAVSIFFVLLSGTIIFFLAKEVFDEKFATLALVIFVTIPIVMIQSHLALENIAPVPFISAWLWMMAKYTQSKKVKYLVTAALALGVSVYSYLGLRLIMPVLAVLSIGYIFFLDNMKKKGLNSYHISIFVLTIIIFFLPLLMIRNQYPGAFFALNKPQGIISYQQFFLPFLSSFDPSFLFLKGDSTPYHSTGKQGMFLLATLPLFVLGLFKIAKDRNPFLFFTMLVFFLIPILYALPGSIYRASRLLSLIPSFILISLAGFKFLFAIKRRIIKLGLISLIIILIAINFADFIYDYWGDYSNRVSDNFEKPIHKVFDFASRLSKKENLEILVQDDIPLRNLTVYSFLENAYFPQGLKRWTEGQMLPAKSIILVSNKVYSRIIKSDNVETKDFGSMDLNLLINRF